MTRFSETLPEQCPPPDAEDKIHEALYRLVASETPAEDAFYSHAKLQRPNRTQANACRFASCSLLSDYQKYLSDMPNLRQAYSHVARLDIPVGYGMSKPKKKNGVTHVDFWYFAGKDLTACVVEVIPLPEEAVDA